jgi:hypothetical protein
MANNIKECLDELLQVDGALGAAVVDFKSGMALGIAGGGVNLEFAAAENTKVIRAKMKTIKSLGIQDKIKDILISLSKQYHLIRLSEKYPNIFFYFVLDKAQANPAFARIKLGEIEEKLQI